MLPCVCSVNVIIRTSVTHTPDGSCATFLFLHGHILTSSMLQGIYGKYKANMVGNAGFILSDVRACLFSSFTNLF